MAKNTKKQKVQMPGSIRQRLSAALCMLLVSAILLVSATYAWFTLSTAPEVTGISTNVGANGNLEIALLNDDTYADLTKITSAVGDSSSVQELTKANITWGNLVDLNDASYGASNFTLNPARLNITEEGKLVGAILSTPTYGADGRVATLEANTVFGTFAETAAAFQANNSYGVRAIGTASAMSPAQLKLRNAIANVAVATSSARSAAQTSLTAQGSVLASFAVNMAMNTDYTPTEEEINAVNAIIASLNTAKGKIEEAIKYAIVAENLSEDASAETDISQVSLDGYTGSISEITSAIAAYKAITIPATLTGTDDPNVKATLKALIDTEKATINGITISEAKNNMQALVDSYMSTGSLTLTLVSGSSPFASIADFTGDYTASITISGLSYGGLSVNNARATMQTKTTVIPAHLVGIGQKIASLNAAEDTSGTIPNITDLYGYAIDLAFRTNAASSDLLLQQDGIQRIYSDATDISTQGGGSYMEFTSVDSANFKGDSMKNLMDSIRVVFLADDTIVAVAVPTVDGDVSALTTIKASLKLTDYEITKDTNGDDVLEVKNTKDDLKIMSLTQNTPTKLTALVYLDGDDIENSDVANAAKSMVGTLNLQFSSSATLNPMEYTPLHSVGN